MHIVITLFGFKRTDLRGKNDLSMTWLLCGTADDVAKANQYGLESAAKGECDSYLVEIA